MKRIDSVLRASVGFAALAAGATTAEAQSTLPPPEVTVAPAAAAPTQPTPSGEIVITGSRIRRDPLNQNAPVVFVDQASIQKTGLSAIADVLQRIPSASGGLNTKVNASGNLGNPPDGGGVGAGSATIDLRYLGANRTLVLVDGLRFVNATSASGIPGSVDLNTIPTNMIDRIEVLQSGASPLYGSDAIAGVVNIITVQQQEGLRASAQYGEFGKGDGQTQDYQASYGIQLPATSIVVRWQLCQAETGLLARPLDLPIPESFPDRLRQWRRRLQQRVGRRPLHHCLRQPAATRSLVRRTARLRSPSSGISRLPTGSTLLRTSTS